MNTPSSALPSALMPPQAVPPLQVPTLAHGAFTLAGDAAANFSLLDFYRGLHCPICLKYLLALGRRQPEFDQRGVNLIAISSDGRERTQAMAARGRRRRNLLAACAGTVWSACGLAAPRTAAGAVAAVGAEGAKGSAAPAIGALRVVPAPEPLRQVIAAGPDELLGLGAGGSLWALSSSGQAARRLATGLDPATPLASGHGRVVARTAAGGLWVWDGDHASTLDSARLAVHAGLLVLPLAVIAVVSAPSQRPDSGSHRLARFERHGAAAWREVARSQEPVLPDARPVLADLEGRGDGGHIAVLAGPDARRYAHGVLGDAIEATRVLWLERHGLETLRALDLPAPHVFEDVTLRPVPGFGAGAGAGLLTVRSGPDGGQLALVTAASSGPRDLHIAALGDTVGGFHRWLAPGTAGAHVVAVHTPHIGGVLHVYTRDGARLSRRRLVGDVSTHVIGSRETDLAGWVRGRLVLPSQDGRRLRSFDPAADWAEGAALALPGRVAQTRALADGAGLAVLLEDGQLLRLS